MTGKSFAVLMISVLLLGLSGCDWSSDADYSTTQGAAYDATGLYIVSDGDPKWEQLMIWQNGQTLRAQDNRGTGLFWEGTVSGTGTTGLNWQWQIYLTCQNQHSGLTEWIRGRIFLFEGLLGTVVRLEGVYTRSDGAETSPFIAEAEYNEEQWPKKDTTTTQ
jgi:hypothetical protein